MRRIANIENIRHAENFSAFLTSQKIKNQLEVKIGDNWGSNSYGTPVADVWIIDEDRVAEAKEHLKNFLNDPEHSTYKTEVPPPPPPKQPREPAPNEKRESMGNFTFYIILICSFTFLMTLFTMPEVKKHEKGLLLYPALISPVQKELMYDYPSTYSQIDRVISIYGMDTIYASEELPQKGQKMLAKAFQTPLWRGVYPYLEGEQLPHTKLFEKIREGEVWRLFTPILLHGGFLHILFNMMWLSLLGTQIERRLRVPRYILLILLLAAFSNTLQYLMSGPQFVGISGVLVGLLTFIWMRQKHAPWEGYYLQKQLIDTMMLFIFAMAGLEMISFFLEQSFNIDIPIGIANTAHLSGGFLGWVIGKTDLFARKT